MWGWVAWAPAARPLAQDTARNRLGPTHGARDVSPEPQGVFVAGVLERGPCTDSAASVLLQICFLEAEDPEVKDVL